MASKKKAAVPPLSVYILLDRSGSMAPRWAATIQAINDYMAGIAADTPDAAVCVKAFDSTSHRRVGAGVMWALGVPDDTVIDQNRDVCTTVRSRMKASSWVPMTTTECHPRGGTPLYDAIGQITREMKGDTSPRGVLVIMTDGEENASTVFTQHMAKVALDGVRLRDWQVVQLGVEFDAYAQAASYGTQAAQTMNVSAKSMSDGTVGETLRRSTVAYASTGAAMGFTETDKIRAAKS